MVTVARASVAFRREAHVPKGGPDGGDGGRAATSTSQADRNTASLLSFRDHPHRRATSGTHGSGQKRHGASGVDLVVTVPEGTVVRARDGDVLADLVRHGDRFLAAHGGRGGRGNARFLSNARRAPSFAEQGEYGEEHWMRLEVKLLADAALVGFPNAGKSTLISSVSAAKPKIADYPFTTLEPHLGVVRFQDHEFVLADIPGLIEGAAEGRGLGHTFLRHVERARVLVILLDLASVDGRTPAEQEEVLLAELGRYRPDLLERPRIVVGSKADVATAAPPPRRRAAAVRRHPRGARRVPRSSRVADRRDPRRGARAGAVRGAAPGRGGFRGRAATRTARGASPVVPRSASSPWPTSPTRRRSRTSSTVSARWASSAALGRAGATEGDVVRVGPVELEYVEGI